MAEREVRKRIGAVAESYSFRQKDWETDNGGLTTALRTRLSSSPSESTWSAMREEGSLKRSLNGCGRLSSCIED
jgi:hypothetical protein